MRANGYTGCTWMKGKGQRLRGLRRSLGLSLEAGDRRSLQVPMLIVLAVLGAMVVASFFLYVSRLTGGSSGGPPSSGNERAYTQTNAGLSPPTNVEVTVEKGATVRWDGTDDVRIIGYNVYRYKAAGDPGSKVNAAIISDTVYHDDEGTMFNSYAVAPVDGNGRQGVVSIPVAAVAEPVSLTGLTPTQEPEMIEDAAFTGSQPRPLPPGSVDCTAEGMTYSGVWYLEHYAEVSGGTLMVTPYYGDSCTYTFAGDSVAVISTRHWNYGIMDVYIDGELRQTVDLYSATVKAKDTVFTASGLGPGAHALKLVCTGRKNPNANFTFIDLEAVQVRQ